MSTHRKQELSDELTRLHTGEFLEEKEDSRMLISFFVSGANAIFMDARMKSVLTSLLETERSADTLSVAIANQLPDEFVSYFAPDQTDEALQQWLASWEKLTESEKRAREGSLKWSFSDWISWMPVSERHWTWFRSELIDPDKLRVDILVDDWPCPVGSFRELCLASGATSVDVG